MATSIATKALSPKVAVGISGVLNLVGAFLSLAVAATIASGLVDTKLVTLTVVAAGLAGGITWNLLTWLFGIPSSSSQATSTPPASTAATPWTSCTTSCSAGPGGPRHRRSPRNTHRNQRYPSPHVHGLNVYSTRSTKSVTPLPPSNHRGQALPGSASSSRGFENMALPPILSSIIAWLRAGYPEGVPDVDYIPLFALLGSQLSDGEASAIADELANESDQIGRASCRERVKIS